MTESNNKIPQTAPDAAVNAFLKKLPIGKADGEADGEADETALPQPDEFTQRHHIANAVQQHAKEQSNSGLSWRNVAIAAVAAVLVLGVGGFIFREFTDVKQTSPVVHSEDTKSTPAHLQPLAHAPLSRFALLHGEVSCNGEAVKLGAHVPVNRIIETRDGQVAFAMPHGVAVGLAGQSALRVLRNDDRSYTVDLLAGEGLFSVDPEKQQTPFKVSTPRGDVIVTGTLFSVAIQENENVSVNVHRGNVKVNHSNGISKLADGRNGATLTDATIVLRPTKTQDSVPAQFQTMGCMDEGRIFTEMNNSACADNAKTSGDLHDEESHPVESTVQMTSNKETKKEQVPPEPTVQSLLETAQKAHAARQFSAEAQALEELVHRFSTTNDARTALISLGRLELRKLGNPSAALGRFSLYLKQGGPLKLEALHGKASAHKALGQTSSEIETLNQLLREFPSDPTASAARQRLSSIHRRQTQ